MTPEMYIKGKLAALAIDEAAHHGGVENMAAVAHVMRNRVNAGWHGGDWMRTLETAGEVVGTIYTPGDVNLRDGAIRLFLPRVDDIFRGTEEDFTDGALYYAELHKIDRPWFRDNVLANSDDHPRIATVGPVAFFG